MLQNKHFKKNFSREREKKSLCRFGYFVLRLKHFHSVELRKKKETFKFDYKPFDLSFCFQIASTQGIV